MPIEEIKVGERSRLYTGDVRAVLAALPERSAHVAISSPPYWGLRSYKTEPQLWSSGWRGEHGSEPTIDLYIQHEVEIWRSLRRVLRDDGVLWINIGDTHQNLQPMQIPARFALALVQDGWYLRSAIVWAKGISFNPDYSGSVMPESVHGWTWERCRVKVKAGWDKDHLHPAKLHSGAFDQVSSKEKGLAEWQPCPGCPKCIPNGGFVLTRGSWRPTSGYEMVYMLTKTANYYCDQMEGKEAGSPTANGGGRAGQYHDAIGEIMGEKNRNSGLRNPIAAKDTPSGGRNIRNVFWLPDPPDNSLEVDILTVNPEPTKEKHFATFPQRLVEPLIKVSTPERGVCPTCGAPWVRVIESEKDYHAVRADTGKPRKKALTTMNARKDDEGFVHYYNELYSIKSQTLGWRPSCNCYPPPADPAKWKEHYDALDTIPATVLDPFSGTATTGAVAQRLGRSYIGIELSPKYQAIAQRRLGNRLEL